MFVESVRSEGDVNLCEMSEWTGVRSVWTTAYSVRYEERVVVCGR